MHTVKIRNTTIGAGQPKICVPLVAEDAGQLSEALARLCKTPYDLVEWRTDFYREVEEENVMRQALELIRQQIGERPLLFTFRTGEEGGNRKIDPETYFDLNVRAAKSGLVDIVDVEINRGEELASRLVRAVHDRQVLALGSFHDFDRTPETEQMVAVLRRMQELDMDITKLAVMPENRRDVLRLLDAAAAMREEYGDRPCVTMAMGSLGVLSRMTGGFTGSAITFATAGAASAPGQIPAEKLKQILHILSECIE